jgi:hypothetical protein
VTACQHGTQGSNVLVSTLHQHYDVTTHFPMSHKTSHFLPKTQSNISSNLKFPKPLFLHSEIIMSSSNQQDPLAAAKQAERDLNSYQAKQGLNNSSDSGIFPPISPLSLIPLFYPSPNTNLTKPTNILSTVIESGVNSYLPPVPSSFLHSNSNSNSNLQIFVL